MNDVTNTAGSASKISPHVGTAYARPRRGLEALTGRLLVAAGEDAVELLEHVNLDHRGLVLVGPDAARGLRRVRAAFPDMALLVDRAPYRKYTATSDMPFYLGNEDGNHESLFPVTLADVAEQQLSEGATMSVLPMGFLAPGDASPLRSAIQQANMLPVGEHILLVPAAAVWLSEQNVKQFVAILKTSKHPVALALNADKNPLDDEACAKGYRRVFTEVADAIPWLTDHSALGAIAYGAPFGVFGFRASHRHIAVEGDTSRTPADKHPHVFVPAMMRWGKASQLRKHLFVTEPAPACFASDCDGRHPDRFRDTTASIFAGGLHNVIAISEEHQKMMTAEEGAEAWWNRRLQAVVVATSDFATRAQRRLSLPPDVQNWLSVCK